MNDVYILWYVCMYIFIEVRDDCQTTSSLFLCFFDSFTLINLLRMQKVSYPFIHSINNIINNFISLNHLLSFLIVRQMEKKIMKNITLPNHFRLDVFFYNTFIMYFGFATLVLIWKNDSICIFKLYEWSIMCFSIQRTCSGGMSLMMRMYFTLGLCCSMHSLYLYMCVFCSSSSLDNFYF